MTAKDFFDSIEGYQTQYQKDVNEESYFGFPLQPILDAEARLKSKQTASVGYLSMEYGIAPSIYHPFKLTHPIDHHNKFFKHAVISNYPQIDDKHKIQIDKMLDIPIYGGGLGVLAGDIIKSCADEGLSVVGVGILWNKGYFRQKFWYKQGQIPKELSWEPKSYPGLIPMRKYIQFHTKEGLLFLRLWKYYLYSYDKRFACPIILLDSHLPQNLPHLQELTNQLYRSDHDWWRAFQRIILGVGGMKALKSCHYNIERYHLNEGHAAFALLDSYLQEPDRRKLSRKFAYTCHTPVAAGHDRFAVKEVAKIFDEQYLKAAKKLGKDQEYKGCLNLTYMCLKNCKHVNAVAKKHREIMQLQFPDFAEKVEAITNGVHIPTWLSGSFRDLFNRYSEVLGDWQKSPENLIKVTTLIQDADFREGIFNAHQINKNNLLNVLSPWPLNKDVLTIAWARRMTGYKRPELIFHNVEKLSRLAYNIGPLQIILAGKAHPNDNIGAAHIHEIFKHIEQLQKHNKLIKVLILENYDTYFGKLLTNSVDIWLNNPLPPFEASGTSGMKAVLNGVLQLTTYDGWIVEAVKADLKGKPGKAVDIGWVFGYQHKGRKIGSEQELRLDDDSDKLYTTLGEAAELYYLMNHKGQINFKSTWIDKMIHCVAQAAYFNTSRAVREYHENLWK
ncbi:MAG: alpha-glucan family phosphorylase [Candidatus Omnitrophica bacterium]|nr:alpha-glucan family phosphorylase [Candidatus Omnitrophota bacterium]MCB9746998.1 alpha-glucan family phosphorylase [Candidatus Omnitrophota bacterium]